MMRDALVLAPFLLPLGLAALCVLAWGRARIQRAIALAGAGALLLVSLALVALVAREGIVVVEVGSWPAPYGITFVADLFSALMVAITGVVAAATFPSIAATARPETERVGLYTLLLVLVGGVCGAFLTGDLFNLYVCFEIILISSFVLIGVGGGKARAEAGIKYVVLNLLASALFLAALGVLYGVAGTVNMAHLSVRLQEADAGVAATVSMLFLVAFGIKAGLFPLFFWLPASYPTLPPAVGGLFAGLLTKVGVYALVRVFTLVFTDPSRLALDVLFWLSLATMLTGVLGALAQDEVRRILSFHIISQIGFMTLGLALHSPLAIAGAVFYVLHHIVVKTNLFLVGGLVARLRGTAELKRLGGLWTTTPLLGLVFLVPALSLVGIPPLSGFWAKLSLVRASVEAGAVVAVVVMLVTSFFTMMSMMKIWNAAFWGPVPAAAAPLATEGPDAAPRAPSLRRLALPVAGLAAITLAIGLAGAPLWTLCERAAAQLLDPAAYVAAVLPEGAP